MRGNRLEVKRSEAIAFAKEWALQEARHRTIFYHLEYPNGGGVPIGLKNLLAGFNYEHQIEVPTQYDCVGAVMAILGCDRVQLPPWTGYYDKKLGYGYVNCDTAIQDADGPQVLFTDARKEPDGPQAGDIVVYGRRLLQHGHIGFLVGGRRVVHCSPSNSRKLGHALAETDAQIWLGRKDRRYLRYRHWAAE